jgi:hypothetical protein
MATYISNAVHGSIFEFRLIQLLDSLAQVAARFVLDEAEELADVFEKTDFHSLPSAIAAADFRIDHIQARAAREILEVLWHPVSEVHSVEYGCESKTKQLS